MVAKFKARGHGPNFIARSLALILAKVAFRPRVCTHTPGVSLGAADMLSRRHDPAKVWQPPFSLSLEITLPKLDGSLFPIPYQPQHA